LRTGKRKRKIEGIRKRPLILAADLPISDREMEDNIQVMISITSEKSSVQSTESTFDQAYQAQETKTVHIVNETTSGEQSGAEHPSKYGYAIFEGYAGEEYLKDLVREILPAALYRTWAIAVGFQAPTNACYVGVSRIAEKAKRGVRQIQKDKREMCNYEDYWQDTRVRCR